MNTKKDLKLKKHTFEDRLKYMRMIDDGHSIHSIHCKYGINEDVLHVLWSKYQSSGSSALRRAGNFKADPELKRKIVLDIEENYLTLSAASLKYGPSPKTIEKWLHVARRDGYAALGMVKKRGRPKDMGRPRKDSSPMTELEKLQKENQELKTEIALLKKVRALVEERNARLREIGHGPSKD